MKRLMKYCEYVFIGLVVIGALRSTMKRLLRYWEYLFIALVVIGLLIPVICEPGMVVGSGATISGSLSVSPTLYNFGTVTNPTTVVYTFALTASGTTIYPAAATESGTDAAYFAETHDCPTSMAPSSTCILTVTYSPPTTTGANNATISIPYTW